eukprot:UN02042
MIIFVHGKEKQWISTFVSQCVMLTHNLCHVNLLYFTSKSFF